MAHSVCTATPSEQLAYIQRLSETLFAPEIHFDDKIQRLFESETKEFGLDHAFLSRIDTEAEVQRFDIVYEPRGDLAPNNTVSLSETYCRKMITDPDGSLAISDATAEGWKDDPAFERFGFESYLGVIVFVDDTFYGGLCYADPDPRPDSITDEEVRLINLQSRWVGFLLHLKTRSPPYSRSNSELDTRALPSSQLNSMLEALIKPERRVVLSILVDEPQGTSLETITQSIDKENTRLRLHHVHLPKLAEEGYIEWDTDTKAVSRGPNFDTIEPLLQCLGQYAEEIHE